ncbi:MAG: MFS transporter, partial [Candidatus Hydrogenedentes bacterium]|nr:MFS transporter [Candidatus Hydrogenedentota bacterium]
MSSTEIRAAHPDEPGPVRGFWALIATQFQGAFNDNAFKFIIIFSLPAILTDPGWQGRVTPFSSFLFTIPWILFAGFAGAVGDRYSKRTVAIATKYWEVGVMVFGLVAFWLRSPSLIWAMLFMMAMQSAFFSPAKYGILPETLPEERLSWANGVLNMMTFVAIIAGTATAGVLLDWLGERIYLTSVPLIGLSIVGVITSHRIMRAPVADPGRRIGLNPWSGLGKHLMMFWRDRTLYMTMLGITFFWAMGLLIQQNVVEHGKAMEYSHTVNGLLQVSLALGIGIGSLVAGIVSGRKIEVGLIPLGAAGLAVFAALLGVPGLGYGAAFALLFMLGFSGGFYNVPLAALLQHRSPADVKGGMIAACNFVNFVGMLVATGIFWLLFNMLGLRTYGIFLACSAITLVVSIYIVSLVPVSLLRLLLWCFAHTVYRMKVAGKQHVPDKGGALLVANHTSFIDALVIIVSIDRPVRFLMAEEIYQNPWIRPLARITGAIPVSPMSQPKDLVRSMRAATEAIESGELVCIFAEGQISRTGQMIEFRKGFEHIMKRVDAPIIPVHLGRLWGSIFSYADGKFFWKLPRRLPFPVTVSYGAPLPNDSSAAVVRAAIQELDTEAQNLRKSDHPLLHRQFIKRARRRPFAFAMADGRVPKLSYMTTLVSSIALGRELLKHLDKQPMVGLLVPQSVGGALANVAFQIMGRVPVNLNYTASPQAIASAVRRCEITQVVTSREFLSRMPIEVPGEPIYLEDIKKAIGTGDRVVALLLAVLCPIRLLERILGSPSGRSQDDLATIIFSSGSEGEPKGIMLSHHNISSNIDSPLQVFPHVRTDRILGILPFFHSFGFTVTLWLPLINGMGAVFHPNPLEAKAIGQLAYKYHPRFLVAPPTFLQNFIRRCLPEELSSLDYIVTGAEKLPARIREAFEAKFGVSPLEGYGTTECAPIVSVNVPDFRAPGYYQAGTRHGTIGRPLPGMSVRVVDIDTGEIILDGRPGLLHVKGPNIMQGYLGDPEKTAEVLQDGWYNTGDVGAIDEDGFVTITDRMSRFSKIAGEMV